MSLTAFQRKRREVKPEAPAVEQAPAPKKPAPKKAKDDAKSESV
jgi:hypothetical protein